MITDEQREAVWRDFRVFFKWVGRIEIEADGAIRVTGDVTARDIFPGPDLPVSFSQVGGEFDLGYQPDITTLKGCPQAVGSFSVKASALQSLDGAPEFVKTSFKLIAGDQLKSLRGLPTKGGNQLILSYTPTLGLLALCGLPDKTRIIWSYLTAYGGANDANTQAIKIVTKYIGQGNKGVLLAAAELIKAGFRDNARL